jgi:hypothetical protein
MCDEFIWQFYVEMKEMDGSWDGNEREKVSCIKYNKIRMIVDIEDGFRGLGAWRIFKYCTVKKIPCCKG